MQSFSNTESRNKPEPAEAVSEQVLHDKSTIDAPLTTTESGIMATEWSFIILLLTAVIQTGVVWISGSVALLGETIHNFSDAATALPLWIAFLAGAFKPSRRFTYGYGRVEDLAGVLIVVSIFASSIVVGWESIQRLIHPQPISHLVAVALAAFIGFLGNEAVALFRLKIGREIGSAALIADGYHARLDGFTSLSVIPGVIGIWLGYPQADSIVGMFMAFLIFAAGVDLGKTIFLRLLDGVDEKTLEEISLKAAQVPGVVRAHDIKARWAGHKLFAELIVEVKADCTIEQADEVATTLSGTLKKQIASLEGVSVRVAPGRIANPERTEADSTGSAPSER